MIFCYIYISYCLLYFFSCSFIAIWFANSCDSDAFIIYEWMFFGSFDSELALDRMRFFSYFYEDLKGLEFDNWFLTNTLLVYVRSVNECF